MAGTINLALTQQFDSQGDPLSGGLLYFFAAGTTTPQTPFQDIALTIAHPNPIILDASGRVPMFYLADGFIKIRLTDKNGVVIIAADQLLVIGPSSGGSGGAGVDPATVLTTGDIKSRYGTGVLDGFVRCNGLTIGQTGSSATELAGLKAQALYEYLWTFPNITLDSAVKGANATSDFGALKRLILPDLRGRTIAGMDDMGATAASRLTSTYWGASAITLGNVGGDEKHSLVLANLPTFTPAGSVTGISASGSGSISGSTSSDGNHTHDVGITVVAQYQPGGNTAMQSGGILTTSAAGIHSHSVSGSCSVSVSGGSGTFTGSAVNPGGSTNHATMAPAMVLTFYMKL